MAKPNYSYEKRQRELAKKKKKEEKVKEKAERKAGHGIGPGTADNEPGATPRDSRASSRHRDPGATRSLTGSGWCSMTWCCSITACRGRTAR